MQIPISPERQPIRLAAVATAPVLREELRLALRDPSYMLGLEITEPLGEIDKEQLARLRQLRPEVVILDLGPNPAVGIRVVQYLAEGDPALQIVALGPSPTPEFLLEAMRAGVTEYLPTAAIEEELPGVLARLARKLRRGTQATREPAKLYTLVSAKGGAGKTTVATNLAVELQQLSGKRTLLVDLELELGETALMLGLHPRFSILDLVKNFHRMDANLLTSYIERHYSGVELLAAPVQLERDALPTREEIRSVLQFLKQHYDYIVVDTPKTLTPAAQAAIEESELVLLLTTPDLPVLRNTKRWLPLLEARVGGRAHGGGAHGGGEQGGRDQREREQGRSERIRLVVNRYSPANVITLEDISSTIELPVSWRLSSDYEAISHATNRGEPAVLGGTSRYAKELRVLSTELAGIRADTSGPGGGLLAGLTARFRVALSRVLPSERRSESRR